MFKNYITLIYTSVDKQALCIFDTSVFYWYKCSNKYKDNIECYNEFIKLWLNGNYTFLCETTKFNINSFSTIIHMKKDLLIINGETQNYKEIEENILNKIKMWDFHDYDDDEQEYEYYDDDDDIAKQNKEELDKLECFSPEFMKNKLNDAIFKIKYLKQLCSYLSNNSKSAEKYYHIKYLNQICRKTKYLDDNLDDIKYNYTVDEIEYSKGYNFSCDKYIKLIGNIEGSFANYSYNRTEGDEKSGYDINVDYSSDYLEKNICRYLLKIIKSKIRWDLFCDGDDSDSCYDYSDDSDDNDNNSNSD